MPAADGRQLASWGKDKTLHIWDVADGKELRKLELGGDLNDQPDNLATSSDGQMLLTTHGETVSVRALATGKELARFALVSATTTRNLAFSPDSRFAAAGSYRGWVYLWRLSAPAEK